MSVNAPRISLQRRRFAHRATTGTDEDGLASLFECLREAESGRRNTLLHPAKVPDERFSDSVGWLSKPRRSSFFLSSSSSGRGAR